MRASICILLLAAVPGCGLAGFGDRGTPAVEGKPVTVDDLLADAREGSKLIVQGGVEGSDVADVTFAVDRAHIDWMPDSKRLLATFVEPGETLSGTKVNVPHAGIADLIVVGTAGGGLALVEKGAQGIAIAPTQGVDRGRRLDAVVLQHTPCEALSDGAAVAGRLRDAGLVLLGKQAIDGDNNQTPQMLAAIWDKPQATFASTLTIDDGTATAVREVDAGRHRVLPDVLDAFCSSEDDDQRIAEEALTDRSDSARLQQLR